jgi:hypothetical protein
MKDGNMKIKTNYMKTKAYKISNTGYNPKTQLMTNSYSAKIFQEGSSVKNTTVEVLKNRAMPIVKSFN